MEEIVKRASFIDVVRAVLSGFLGIRRKAAHERAHLHPAQIIVAAIVLVALFILTLRTVVHLITS